MNEKNIKEWGDEYNSRINDIVNYELTDSANTDDKFDRINALGLAFLWATVKAFFVATNRKIVTKDLETVANALIETLGTEMDKIDRKKAEMN